MTPNEHCDSRTSDQIPSWITPSTDEGKIFLRTPDEIDAELARLALAFRAFRDLVGPTFTVQELSDLVRWLLREAQSLSPAQRRQASDFIRDGMGL